MSYRVWSIEIRESVMVPQTQSENASKESTHENEIRTEKILGEGDKGNAPTHKHNEAPPYVEPQQSGSPAKRKLERRYSAR